MIKLRSRIADGVPQWVVWCAYATTLTVLPSSIWRIALVVGNADLVTELPPPGAEQGLVVSNGPAYVIALSIVSELVAYLTVGLVATWGEVVPRWVPGLGGRRIPALAAVVPASIGATICTVLWPYVLLMLALGRKVNGDLGPPQFDGWQAVAFWAAYGPLVLWGPLVWIATVQYWRRRSAAQPVTAEPVTAEPVTAEPVAVGGVSASRGRW